MVSAVSTLRWRAANARNGPGGKATLARIGYSLLIASSLLFGVPVVLGIVVSIVRLVGLRYTGQVYTPLFPAVVGLFDRLYLWNGWPLVRGLRALLAAEDSTGRRVSGVAGPGVATLTAPAVRAPVALIATHGVAIDLSEVRLEH
jgi:hypothetical protein